MNGNTGGELEYSYYFSEKIIHQLKDTKTIDAHHWKIVTKWTYQRHLQTTIKRLQQKFRL